MPPAFVLALGLIGAAALVRWCVKEAHRVNSELDSVREVPPADPVDRGTLKRDPNTGEYRPG